METINKWMSFGTGKLTIGRVLIALIIFIVCSIIIKVILRIVRRTSERSKVDNSAAGYITTVVKIILYFITVIIVCDYVGIPISSLIALFSVAGLAISLSVQDLLSNLISGFVILVTKPFLSGDYVEIADKSGKISEVGFMHTALLTFDNKIVYIPNKEVSSSEITNYTREDKRRVDISVSASYKDSAKTVRASILSTAEKIDKILNIPVPFVGVAEYESSSIRYDVRVWCKNEDYWDVYYMLNEAIKVGFDNDGITMTYDHLNVHIDTN